MILLLEILIFIAGYSLACLGAGVLGIRVLFIRREQFDQLSAGTELVTAFILGQGLLASLWLVLGLTGSFSPHVVAGFALVCALGGVFLTRRRLVDFVRQLISIWKELRHETWSWQILAGLTLLLILSWFTSLGRSMMGDAAAFYMILPKIMADLHELIPVPGYESFMSVGLQGEMHYAALMVLGSADAAQLFEWPTILAGDSYFWQSAGKLVWAGGGNGSP